MVYVYIHRNIYKSLLTVKPMEEEVFNPKVHVSTNLESNLWNLAKKNFIPFNKSLSYGVCLFLVEAKVLDITEIPQNFFTKEIRRLKKEKADLIIKLVEMETKEIQAAK